MAFALDQQPDRDQGLTAQAKCRAGGVPIGGRTKQFGIDTVAQHGDLALGRADFHQRVLQRGADRDQRRGTTDRLPDHPPWPRETRDQANIGAARGDDHRQAEAASKPYRRDAIGIDIMRVDRIERVTLAQQTPDHRQHGAVQQQRRERHADARDDRETRMQNGQPVPRFGRDHSSVNRPIAEPRMIERKPRHRRHDLAARLAAGDEVTQTVLHEHAVIGPRVVRVQRRERQQPKRHPGIAKQMARIRSLSDPSTTAARPEFLSPGPSARQPRSVA